MSDTVLLPRKLTAENGAKALLISEFSEHVFIECYNCYGDGIIDDEVCGECDGSGEFGIEISVKWTTIKKIYDMIVDNLEQKTPDESGAREGK